MGKKTYPPVDKGNKIYLQVIAEINRKEIPDPTSKHYGKLPYDPPQAVIEQITRIVDLAFQIHPEMYSGTDFPSQNKGLLIILEKDSIQVEYFDFLETFHLFEARFDGTMKYIQTKPGAEGTENWDTQYEQEGVFEKFDDNLVRRHLRRKGWPT